MYVQHICDETPIATVIDSMVRMITITIHKRMPSFIPFGNAVRAFDIVLDSSNGKVLSTISEHQMHLYHYIRSWRQSSNPFLSEQEVTKCLFVCDRMLRSKSSLYRRHCCSEKRRQGHEALFR